MNSLRNRLSFGLIVSLMVLLLAQWWLSSRAIENLLEKQLLDQLQLDSEALLAGVEFDAAGALALSTSGLVPAYQQPYSGTYFALQHRAEVRYSRSLWDADFNITRPEGSSVFITRQPGPDGQHLLVHARNYEKDNQQFTIAIARDITPLRNNLKQYQLANAGFSALFLLALVLIQRLIVINTLKPLNAVQAALARLQQGEIRQLEFQGPDEIKPLVDELNRLLTAIDQRLKRSREGMGNLAHALKTRLARLSQLSDESDRRQFIQEVHTLTAEVARLIDRETARVRVVGDLRPGQRIDLLEILKALASSCKALYRDKALHFDIQVPQGTTLLGDREDLFELFGNLIDNASKWANNQVIISLQGTTLEIRDDGPGCPADSLAEITQRGFRADENTPGSGLGLAIAQDIAGTYGAVLEFANKAPGLAVRITFKPGTLI